MRIEELTIDNQGTKEWLVDRLGKWTGSEIEKLFKKGRAKDKVFGDTAESYIRKKMAERRIAKSVIEDQESWEMYVRQTMVTNRAMEFGSEMESYARAEYVEKNGTIVLTTGSINHPTIPNFSSSPDGVVPDEEGVIEGCVEYKVPNIETYILYENEIKDNETLKVTMPQYFYQCQSHMAVTGAKWCDFCAYQPFLTNGFHQVRITRDEEAIAQIEERIALAEQFVKEHEK